MSKQEKNYISESKFNNYDTRDKQLKKHFKTMSGNDLKKPIIKGMIISSIVNFSVILFLIIKLITS